MVKAGMAPAGMLQEAKERIAKLEAKLEAARDGIEAEMDFCRKDIDFGEDETQCADCHTMNNCLLYKTYLEIAP